MPSIDKNVPSSALIILNVLVTDVPIIPPYICGKRGCSLPSFS